MIIWDDLQRWAYEALALYGLYQLTRIAISAEAIARELKSLREASAPGKFG